MCRSCCGVGEAASHGPKAAYHSPNRCTFVTGHQGRALPAHQRVRRLPPRQQALVRAIGVLLANALVACAALSPFA